MTSLPQRDWKNAETIEHAKQLIELGYILKYSDSKKLCAKLQDGDHIELINYMATILGERHDSHLSMEILVETLLIMIHSSDYNLTYHFIGEVINLDNYHDAISSLVRTIFRIELTNQQLQDELFALGTLMVSELGISLWHFANQFPNESKKVDSCLQDIVTHLQSIANENSPYIRLCLLRFFGVFNAVPQFRFNFNRILGRFAHTLLEQLFTEYFNKKNESLAQEYLLDNLPYIFEANGANQQIMHNIFRQFFLKYPERFIHFYKTLCLHLMHSDNERHFGSAPQFLEHTVALFALSNDLNNRAMVKEFAQILSSLSAHFHLGQKMTTMVKQVELKRGYREILDGLVGSLQAPQVQNIKNANVIKVEAKRGRKHTLAKQLEISSSLMQVTKLGASILKAS